MIINFINEIYSLLYNLKCMQYFEHVNFMLVTKNIIVCWNQAQLFGSTPVDTIYLRTILNHYKLLFVY